MTRLWYFLVAWSNTPQNMVLLKSICLYLSLLQLEEELSGIVEVIGMVSNKGAVMANTYNMLQEDKGTPFGNCTLQNDMTLT